MSEAAVQHYLDEYARVRKHDNGHWLDQQRQTAIETFRQTGFPTLRHEDWKYTDVRPIIKRNFVAADTKIDDVNKNYVSKARFSELDCHELVFINGVFSAPLSNIATTRDKIIIKSLADAIAENNTIVEPFLNRFDKTDANAFINLNIAFMTNGAFIYVPDKCIVDKPINLIFLASKQAQPSASHLRNLIVLGEDAQLAVIETFIGIEGAEYFNNSLTEITVGNGSVLEHYKFQQESLKGYHVGNMHILQQHNSRVESHSISLGGALVRNNIDCELAEQHAEIILNGLYIAAGRQHIDNHTCVKHIAPHTHSEEFYRGVLDSHSRGVFNGKVIVQERAQKTDAHQSNANLLLSDNAEVDTKPELEIYADDVKCSHGATIGQLDEDMLFYLRSRAIQEETARSLLIFAFADDVIGRIKYAPIRERIEEVVVGKLPDTKLIKEFIR